MSCTWPDCGCSFVLTPDCECGRFITVEQKQAEADLREANLALAKMAIARDNMQDAYELKIQDLARETLRSSALTSALLQISNCVPYYGIELPPVRVEREMADIARAALAFGDKEQVTP